MNCRGWNPHIALYVEGDLDPDLTRQVEAHLNACVECREFAEELQESQATVRELKNEIIENVSLNRVRSRVLDQVRRMNENRTSLDRIRVWLWGGFRWRYAVLGSVALVAMSLAVWRLTFRETPLAPPAATIPMSPAPVLAATATESPAPIHAVVVPQKHRAARPVRVAERTGTEKQQESKPDTVVQILTNDPNVVIYWLLDQTGGL
jgi:anti-sigma factor RsiW